MKDLLVRVKEIKGNCPVYRVGQGFSILDGYRLSSDFPLCLHSLASIMPYYISLSRGTPPRELGLGEGDEAYLQCLDPCQYTGGGTVIFEIKRADPFREVME